MEKQSAGLHSVHCRGEMVLSLGTKQRHTRDVHEVNRHDTALIRVRDCGMQSHRSFAKIFFGVESGPHTGAQGNQDPG